MRIRKNAKISAFLNTNSNLSRDADECQLQNLCQLNQSPWDIITFPSSDSSSSFYQFDDNEVYYNVNLAGTGNSIDSIGDFESVASKTSGLGENDNFNGRNGAKNDYGEMLGFKEEGETSDQIQEEIQLCGKRDDNGWQCGSVVKYGNTMCDYHLSVSEQQNHTVRTTKKKSGLVSGLTTGTRPSRGKKRPTTNPHDFYYYSGFGPSWGKKRGALGTVSNGKTGYGTGGNDMDAEKETGKRFEPKMSEVGPMELDYIGDDDDDDDNENGNMGGVGEKRRRKPIKERSLKSLM